MFFFEGKQELYYVLCLIVVPIVSCLPFSFGRTRHSWYALLANAALFIATTYIFFPYFFRDFVSGNPDSTTMYWMVIFVPIQIAVSLIVTTILYYIKKRHAKHKR